MNYLAWLLLGVGLGVTLLFYSHSRGAKSEMRILSLALIIAAVIYVGFALSRENMTWFAIEMAGVAVFGMFVWLATQYSPLWLAIGWGVHPLWDVGLHLLGPGWHVAPEWYAVACISFDLLLAGYILKYLRNLKNQQVKE